jgi:DnaJ homolog subfamily A member 5
MGAQQSSQEGTGTGARNAHGGPATARKTCYYEILEVDRSAADSEIRKAYKKKALELHPDRNFHDVENATKKFAEVQTAYEILSDPQERAWYDSHRDAILRGDADSDDAPPEHYNVRLTTTEEIMTLIGRFNRSVPFNDSPNGFFGILDITFGQLATEEAAACEWEGAVPVEYPPFGSSDDEYDLVAKPFYSAWSNFATRKSFSWKEKWRLSDAPDRRVRRLMEKENKKMRDDAIRDFNDAVRSLVAFVKKRDPRYVPNTQSEAERQKVLRDSAIAQAERARAANRQKLDEASVAEWAQSRADNDEYNDEFATSEEESEVEHFECVVCNKTFKSEKQYETHEKSKKHVKAVQQLRRQMKHEGLAFALDEPVDTTGAREDEPQTTDASQEPVETEAKADEVDGRVDGDVEDGSAESSSEAWNDEYAPREAVEGRLAAGSMTDSGDELETQMTDVTLDDDPGPTKEKAKLNKAKLKRAKKEAKQAAQATSV